MRKVSDHPDSHGQVDVQLLYAGLTCGTCFNHSPKFLHELHINLQRLESAAFGRSPDYAAVRLIGALISQYLLRSSLQTHTLGFIFYTCRDQPRADLAA